MFFFQQFEAQNVHILFLYAIYAKLHNFNTFSDRVQNWKEIRQYMYIIQHSICYSWSLLVLKQVSAIACCVSPLF